VAEAYTKLIEFKVKDNAIKAATVRLFRSLERIEKKLDEIGGKGGRGFDKVAKGADKASASFKQLQKTTNTLASASNATRKTIVATTAGLWLANKATTALDSSMRGVTVAGLKPFAAAANATTGKILALKAGVVGLAAAHPILTGAIAAGVGAYTLFGSKTGDVIKKLKGITQGLYNAEAAVRKFVSQIKTSKTAGSELTIFDRIQSAKGGGLVGLKKLLDQVTAAQSKLISTNLGYVSSSEKVRAVEKALNAELMARKRIMDQIITNERARTPTSTLTAAAGEAGGLEGLKNLLTEAEGIQNRLLSTDEKYKVAAARVRSIQKAINAELRQRELIMGKINIKEEKSISLGERLRGIAGNLGGKAVQAARPGRAMERRGLMVGTGAGLAGLGMAQNSAIGQFMGKWAVNPAMGGLKNAAGMAMGAHIPGAGIAAKGIADTKMALVGLTAAAKTAAGIALLNPQAIGLLASAWLVFGNKGIRGAIEKLFGAERAAKKTTAGLFEFAKANPILSRLNMKLEMSKDAMKQLGDAANKAQREIAALQNPGMKGNVIQNTRASRASRAGSGFAEWSQRLGGTGTASARDVMIKSLERKNRRLVQLGQERLKGDRLINKEMRNQEKNAVKIEKAADRTNNKAKQRLKNWKKIRAQKAENLMLGAGFPLLFGGGAGATAGGVTGSLIGNAMGMGGFGTQIIGSAIGTMMDTAIQKVATLADALKELNVDNLVESGIRLTGEIQAQVQLLKEAGNAEQARALVAAQITRQTGLTQGSTRDINNAVKLLQASWNDVAASVGGVLGILASPLIVALAGILKLVNLAAVGFNTIAGAVGRIIPGSSLLQGLWDKISRSIQNTRKEAILLQREIKKIGDMSLLKLSLTGQRTPGTTFAGQRKNTFLDFEAFRADFNAETRSQAKDIRTKHTDPKEQNRLIGELNKTRSVEFRQQSQTFVQQFREIDAQEIKSIETMTRQVENLKLQNGLVEKINVAKKAGDIDTVNRLQLESQILDIKLQESQDLSQAKSIKEENLIKEKAALDIARARLNLAGQLTEEEKKLKKVKEQITQSIENGIVNALEAAINKTKTLGEVAANVFRQISRQLLQVGVNSILNNFMPGLFPMRAKGGPVKGGSPYIVGEKGPELFVPGSSGNVVPNHEMGGANIVVNVDASGSEVEGNQGQAAELGRMLGAAIQAELIKEKRPGGLLAGR
jgi:hypothetical protein